ncbi:MAG: toprim domain-containing protein [Synechococcus sp.]
MGCSAKRLVVPLCDPAGAVLGFAARSMGDQRPKYRNSAADLLFQRNSVVFGLDQARHSIEAGGVALLVEGPLDVIQLHQAGIEHAVACLGTSVSELQLALLQRHGMQPCAARSNTAARARS